VVVNAPPDPGDVRFGTKLWLVNCSIGAESSSVDASTTGSIRRRREGDGGECLDLRTFRFVAQGSLDTLRWYLGRFRLLHSKE